MKDSLACLFAVGLIVLALPVLLKMFKTGKDFRDFEHKYRGGKMLDHFDEENDLIDKYSR